ncbi:MAG TPA: flagellar GTP-binding protein [Opitutaceae bacterium]|nr:flagellar GTP-binding protein [Opitutaceae bacterium]
MSAPTNNVPPGSVYRIVVRSADEAVQTIRDQFGSETKVLSVRQLEGQGLAGWFGRPKLEVVVQVGSPAPSAGPLAAVLAAPAGESPEPAVVAVADESASLHGSAPVAIENRKSKFENSRAPALPDLLRRSGFSETMLARLNGSPTLANHAQRPLHVSLVELSRELRHTAARRRPRPLPARTAFLGSRGVGRTTALCKWLAAEIFSRGRTGRVLTVEFDQPNLTADLAVYCEALGLTLEHHTPGLDLAAPAGGFVYADLPGFAIGRPAANHDLARFLDAGQFEGRVLVLHALYDHAALRAAYAAGCELGATHLVFTHCDELTHWGKLVDFLIDGDLTPLFLSTGPSLSGDCEEDAVNAVLRKTLPGA